MRFKRKIRKPQRRRDNVGRLVKVPRDPGVPRPGSAAAGRQEHAERVRDARCRRLCRQASR